MSGVWGAPTLGKLDALESRLSLHPDPAGLSAARSFVADVLGAWGTPSDRQTARLLVSELVTNAIVHAHTHIALIVRGDGHLLTIEVHDGSDQLPVLRDVPDITETSGRGLNLVAALSVDWGVRIIPGSGKVVWFTLTPGAPVVG